MDRRDFLKVSVSATAAMAAAELMGMRAAYAGTMSSRFGLSDELLRKTLEAALSRGGDYADVYCQYKTFTNVSLEDDKVDRARTGVELGVGVRVTKGDSTGYAYSESLDEKALIKAAKIASEIANGSPTLAPKSLALEPVRRFYRDDTKYADLDVAKKIALVQSTNAQIKAKDANITKISLSYTDEESEILIVSSDGIVRRDFQPQTSLYSSVVAEKNGRRETGGYALASREGFGFYTQERVGRLVDETLRRTNLMFDATQLKGGEMPVVLGAGASGILLHEAIGHGMEADFNRKNASTYASRLNKPIAKPFVNVVDDGTIENARGALNVDDEGTPTERTLLVEDGVLRTYMHDRISAKHYGVKPTGSGRRESFRYPVLPRMRATYMLNGPHKREEIVKSVKHGIFCESFSNGQVNIGSGDFTFFVKTGYLIENGKLGQPIKDVNIIGNGPDVLAKITMVADDLVIDEGGWTCGKDGQGVPVSQGMPTALVSAITVGGKA
jgi:TldD protein